MGFKRTILMDPFPKERPRFKRGRAHMSSRYMERKDLCRMLVGNFRIKKDTPLSMTLMCYRAIPKSWTEKKRKDMAGTWTTAGGDADNLAGGVMDALFDNDHVIVSLHVERRWSDRSDRQGYMKLEIREV